MEKNRILSLILLPITIGMAGLSCQQSNTSLGEMESVSDSTCTSHNWQLISPSPIPGEIDAIWGTSEILAAISNTSVWMTDGEQWWTKDLEVPLNDIWGVNPSRIYVVGDDGAVFLYNGEEWMRLASPSTETLTSVWGSGEANVFVHGLTNESLFHFNGSNWTNIPLPISYRTNSDISIWGNDPNYVFFAYKASDCEAGDSGSVIIWGYDGSNWSLLDTVPSGCSRGIFWESEQLNLYYRTGYRHYQINSGTVIEVTDTPPDDLLMRLELEQSLQIISENISLSAAYQDAEFANGPGNSTWAASYNGLFALEGEEWKKKNGVGYLEVSGMGAVDNDELVLVSYNGPKNKGIHYTNNEFRDLDVSLLPSSSTYVDGTTGDEIYIVGNYGGVARFDGIKSEFLRPYTFPRRDALVALAQNDVFVLGPLGTGLEHFDGNSLTQLDGPFEGMILSGVAATGPDDVYTWGKSIQSDTSTVQVFHFSGDAWEEMIVPSDGIPCINVTDFYVSSSVPPIMICHDSYIFTPHIYMWNGTEFENHHVALVEDDVRLNSVSANGTDNVLIAGSKGICDHDCDVPFLIHYDGSTWEQIPLTDAENASGIVDIVMMESGQIYATDWMHNWTANNGTDWTLLGTSVGRFSNAGDQLYGYHKDAIYRLEDGEFIEDYQDEQSDILAMSTLPDGTAYALLYDTEQATGTLLFRENNQWSPKWTERNPCPMVTSLFGKLADRPLLGCSNGSVLMYDGIEWIESPTGSERVGDIWATDPNNVYAVGTDSQGSNGILVHYNGTNWSTLDTGASGFVSVAGTAHNNIYAAGAQVLVHFNGTKWSNLEIGDTYELTQIAVTSGGNVFAATEGTSLEVDGDESWSTNILRLEPDGWKWENTGLGAADHSYLSITPDGSIYLTHSTGEVAKWPCD